MKPLRLISYKLFPCVDLNPGRHASLCTKPWCYYIYVCKIGSHKCLVLSKNLLPALEDTAYFLNFRCDIIMISFFGLSELCKKYQKIYISVFNDVIGGSVETIKSFASYFFKKNSKTQVLFMGPLMPFFCTSGDICLGFQARVDPSLTCFLACVRWIPQIVYCV